MMEKISLLLEEELTDVMQYLLDLIAIGSASNEKAEEKQLKDVALELAQHCETIEKILRANREKEYAESFYERVVDTMKLASRTRGNVPLQAILYSSGIIGELDRLDVVLCEVINRSDFVGNKIEAPSKDLKMSNAELEKESEKIVNRYLIAMKEFGGLDSETKGFFADLPKQFDDQKYGVVGKMDRLRLKSKILSAVLFLVNDIAISLRQLGVHLFGIKSSQ